MQLKNEEKQHFVTELRYRKINKNVFRYFANRHSDFSSKGMNFIDNLQNYSKRKTDTRSIET